MGHLDAVHFLHNRLGLRLGGAVLLTLRGLLGRLGDQLCVGGADALQPALGATQLLGQRVATTGLAVLGVFLRVGLLGSGQQLAHLLLQTLLLLFHAGQAHGLVLGGVSTQLGWCHPAPPRPA